MYIIVSNLNGHTTASNLRSLFTRYGHVAKCELLKAHYSSSSLNLGIVVMEDGVDAVLATRKLNNTHFMHRFIGVKKAQIALPQTGSRYRLYMKSKARSVNGTNKQTVLSERG